MLNPDNATLEWCAKWIEDSLRAETNERTIEFGKNMAMTIRAVKTKGEQLSTTERDIAYADGYRDGFRQGQQSRAPAPVAAGDDEGEEFDRRCYYCRNRLRHDKSAHNSVIRENQK